jgi:ATP synthase subunit 6/ATP synthase F0 subunit c
VDRVRGASHLGGERRTPCQDPVPRGWRSVFEVFIKYIRDEIARKAIGAEGDRYLPYLLTCFFFIWTCNLLGLIPGLATPTSNISVTAALAVLAFVMIHLAGIRRYGVVKHLKHVMPGGLPAWLYPIMLPVEILGMLTKPFALCIRLFANMTAGHGVIIGLISLIFILKSIWSPRFPCRSRCSSSCSSFSFVSSRLSSSRRWFRRLSVCRSNRRTDAGKEEFHGSEGSRVLGCGLGAGLALIGTGIGIGRLAASAMEGIARQPQSAGTIQTAMLIAAGLIEGAALFALVICFLLYSK